MGREATEGRGEWRLWMRVGRQGLRAKEWVVGGWGIGVRGCGRGVWGLAVGLNGGCKPKRCDVGGWGVGMAVGKVVGAYGG